MWQDRRSFDELQTADRMALAVQFDQPFDDVVHVALGVDPARDRQPDQIEIGPVPGAVALAFLLRAAEHDVADLAGAQAEIEDEEGKGVSMMARPKYVRKMLGGLNTAISRRNAVLLIANQTQEIPTRHGSKSETNIGGGLKFFASVRVETWAGGGGFDEGGFYEGIATQIKIVKNKDNRAFAELSVPIYSETTPDGFPPGVDNWMGILNFLSSKEVGFIKNASGWWSCPAFVDVVATLAELPTGFEKLKDGKIIMKNARIRNRGELATWLAAYPGLDQFLINKIHELRKLMWRV